MPLSDDEKQLVADWARHPAEPAVRRWLIEKRAAEEAALGAALFRDPGSYDPIAVARKAGDFSNAMEFLNHLRAIAKADERAAKKATEEDN